MHDQTWRAGSIKNSPWPAKKARGAVERARPEIKRAFAKAREDIKNAHIDAKIEKSVDEAMSHAEVKLDARGDNTGAADDSASDSE